MNIQLLSAFVLYFSALFAVGFYFYKKTKNSADFSLGNRSLNFWVTAIAAHATDMSAWLFLGMPAYIYLHGLFNIWIAVGLTGGMFVCWHFVAPKLRVATEDHDSLTLASYFESKFNDTSGTLRIISGFVSLIFFSFYIAAGLVAMGYVFESVFGIEYHLGLILGLAAAAGYTMLGGFAAVAWNDFFQGLFLLAMIVLVPVLLFFKIDGLGAIQAAADARNVSLTLIHDYSPRTVANILNVALFWGLGYFGMPHVLVNFMGIDKAEDMHKAKYVGITWQMLSLGGAVAVGLMSIAYFPHGITNPQLVFVEAVKDVFPPFFGGLVLCAILAATISTLDTQILLSASIITEDIYKRTVNPKATGRELLLMSRIATVLAPLFALAIAWRGDETVIGLVEHAWAGLGGAFGPLVLVSLYGKSVPAGAAITGVIVGAVTSVIWPTLNTPVLPMVPAFVASFIAIYAVAQLHQNR